MLGFRDYFSELLSVGNGVKYTRGIVRYSKKFGYLKKIKTNKDERDDLIRG